MNKGSNQTFEKIFLIASVLLILTTLSVAAADPSTGGALRSPNIIIIYSDDHGYTDLGLFGIDSNVDTPYVDRLACDGALMTGGYASAPQCRPSRAGLMRRKPDRQAVDQISNRNKHGRKTE